MILETGLQLLLQCHPDVGTEGQSGGGRKDRRDTVVKTSYSVDFQLLLNVLASGNIPDK